MSRQSAVGSEQRQHRGASPRTAFCLLLTVYCFLSSGCLSRSLTIRTEPSGALVYVNDQLKGASPVTYDFMWYGWHRVMIRKEGYERIEDRKELRAPIWLWIPLDLVVEAMPFRWRDDRAWSYTLAPIQLPAGPLPPMTSTTLPMQEATHDAR